jgi:hypothetical protein
MVQYWGQIGAALIETLGDLRYCHWSYNGVIYLSFPNNREFATQFCMET